MKFLILFALFALASCELSLDEKALNALANLKAENLPETLRAKLNLLKFKAGDDGHWCCTNDQPVNTVQRTKIIKEVHVVATKIKTGYTSCGFNGWMMCSVYATSYRNEVVYVQQTYEVPDETACADHHVKCCKDFLEVAGNCLSLATVSQNIDILQALVAAGLLGGIGK